MQSNLKSLYDKLKTDLEQAAQQLHTILAHTITNIEDKALVRAELRSVRIKSLPSLERKANSKSWSAYDALNFCSDLVGGRVVCNNVEDVYRFAELLRDQVPDTSFDSQDYIEAALPSGYRALHVNFRIDVGKNPMMSNRISCEVQIRSRLQDAWAELSHDDIYKKPALPEDLRDRATDLADVLATADRIAGAIRARVKLDSTAPTERPNLAKVSVAGLSFIFKEAFGHSPPDYLMTQANDLCEELGIKSLASLSKVLADRNFRKHLETTYQAILPAPLPRGNEYLAALIALATGPEQAVAKVRQDAQAEWAEIDAVWRRELLAELPSTIEELLEDLERSPSEASVELWAQALSAATSCDICNTSIVSPSDFAERALAHYEVVDDSDLAERIEAALFRSGAETGGYDNPTLCAYHSDQMAKDD